MSANAMPEPKIDNWNRPFWSACEAGRLIVQKCRMTGKTWFPPGPVSPFAPAAGWDWIECSGKGQVLSWVVFHQKYFAGFAERIPYNVALIRLEEGALLFSNIDGPNAAIEIGQRVKVWFERRGAFNVPVFTAGGQPDQLDG